MWGFVKQKLVEIMVELLIKFILGLLMKIFALMGDLLCKALGLAGDMLCHVAANTATLVAGNNPDAGKALNCNPNIFADFLLNHI